MKIATFNINNVNKRLANLLGWLRRARPDVTCLQELKATNSEFPIAAIERAGYGAVWRGQKYWNGIAILARDREPVVTRATLPGDSDDTQSEKECYHPTFCLLSKTCFSFPSDDAACRSRANRRVKTEAEQTSSALTIMSAMCHQRTLATRPIPTSQHSHNTLVDSSSPALSRASLLTFWAGCTRLRQKRIRIPTHTRISAHDFLLRGDGMAYAVPSSITPLGFRLSESVRSERGSPVSRKSRRSHGGIKARETYTARCFGTRADRPQLRSFEVPRSRNEADADANVWSR
jgi:hypothetical protein